MSRATFSALNASMPELAPVVVNSHEFVCGRRVVEGAVPLARLQRLSDLLLDLDGNLAVRLAGWQDADRVSWLRLTVAGQVNMCCQCCLGSVSWSLDIVSLLRLVGPGEAWPDEDLADDGVDAIAVESELDVLSLVEDEVLLALPIAPRHPQCEPPQAAENEYGSSPFMALAALKKH